VLGSIRFDRGQLERAIESFDRAIAIDPKFAQAWAARGGCLAYLGRTDDAKSSLDKCLAISASATECMWYRAQFDELEGACEKEESDVRAWLGRDPEDYYAYHWLAKSLFALGKSEEAVRTALEQKWVRVGKSRREKIELDDRVRLDMAAGDFAAAEKKTLELEQKLADEPGALAHAESHGALVEIYRETGRDVLARKIAEAYVARKDAWVTPHRVDDRAIWEDALPLMLSAMLHTGALTPAQFEERRTAWISGWESKTTGPYVSFLWIYGYALPVESPAEAKAAVATLTKYSPLPTFTPTSLAPAYVGRALLEAGRTDEAIAELTKATKNCIALYLPVAHTRASLYLGQALEAKGDAAGACASYAKVVERWGHAKPRSITAEKAKARMAALRCGK
jgi:serine/threonine-protein kinase